VEIGRFNKPVKIQFGRAGKTRIINSTGEAAECLVGRWPVAGGRKYRAAGKACLTVLERGKKVRAARKAFKEAAAEADILLP
jgi:hypothetical protein